MVRPYPDPILFLNTYSSQKKAWIRIRNLDQVANISGTPSRFSSLKVAGRIKIESVRGPYLLSGNVCYLSTYCLTEWTTTYLVQGMDQKANLPDIRQGARSDT